MATIHEVRRAFCLSRAQLFGVRDGVTAAIEARLVGRESSLALLPSFLRRPAGLPSGTYLALDFGGSNIRAARIELAAGRLCVQRQVKRPLVDPAGRYDYRQRVTTTELFAFVAAVVSEAAGEAGGLLGHTFSFPADQTDVNTACLRQWTKEMAVAGAEGKNVQQLLAAALGAIGRHDIEPVALINDTVATLLAGAQREPATVVGTICGTGHNSCYEEAALPRPMIVNAESGNFDGAPANCFDEALDRQSQFPGRQRLEKMTSGQYLGELVRLAAGEAGVALPDDWRAASLAPALGGKTDHDTATLVRAVTERAGQLVAAELAALVRRAVLAPGATPVVAADGAVFARLPLFRQTVQAWLPVLAEQPARLQLTPDGSLLGAAIAAAWACEQR